jgi:hypothetical protein
MNFFSSIKLITGVLGILMPSRNHCFFAPRFLSFDESERIAVFFQRCKNSKLISSPPRAESG